MASGAEVLSSTQFYDWTNSGGGKCAKKLPYGIYWGTLQTLRAMREPVGRGSGSARPILWRLRHSGASEAK